MRSYSLFLICFSYHLTGFYMIRDFTEWYFLTDSSYGIENHFCFANAPNYCFEPPLCRIICVYSSVKVSSPRYGGPSIHLFRTPSPYMFIIYRKKESGFEAKFCSQYLLGQR